MALFDGAQGIVYEQHDQTGGLAEVARKRGESMSWIPITVAQPPDGQLVMLRILDDMDFKTPFSFERDGKYCYCCANGDRRKIVTHWKPLTRLAIFAYRQSQLRTESQRIKLYKSFLEDAPPEVRAWLESEVQNE